MFGFLDKPLSPQATQLLGIAGIEIAAFILGSQVGMSTFYAICFALVLGGGTVCLIEVIKNPR